MLRLFVKQEFCHLAFSPCFFYPEFGLSNIGPENGWLDDHNFLFVW